MVIEVWWLGKTGDDLIDSGIRTYQERIKRLYPVKWVTLPDIRRSGSMENDQRKEKEGELILSRLQNDDHLILLDERGKEYTSQQWATWIERQMSAPGKRLVLLIGGAFGFSPAIYERANGSLALSKMTFTHEMVRLILAEQLYRAFTILNNIKYHY